MEKEELYHRRQIALRAVTIVIMGKQSPTAPRSTRYQHQEYGQYRFYQQYYIKDLKSEPPT
ncbi:MAG: hypothetical protein ACLUR5_17320 [Eubacterium ventriosum]